MFYYCAFGYINRCTSHMRYCNNNMHKKSFCDWAYSAQSYLAGLKSGCEGQGRVGRQETKGGGGSKRQDKSSPVPTIPGSATARGSLTAVRLLRYDCSSAIFNNLLITGRRSSFRQRAKILWGTELISTHVARVGRKEKT